MGRADLASAVGTFQGGSVIDTRVVSQDVRYELATLAFDGGTLVVTNAEAVIGESVRVRIRARDVSIALDAPRAISIQNVLQGTITTIGPVQGGIVVVSIAVGVASLRSRITRRAAEQLALKPGMEVYALIKAVSLDRHGVGYAG
jgi:molybdate transport system ATP-binding protein